MSAPLATRRPLGRLGALGSVLTGIVAPTLLVAAACGGGGGDGGGDTPTEPGLRASFARDASAASPSIGLVGHSSGSRLVLDLRAAGARDLYGYGVDLEYPPALLRFEGLTEGVVLSGEPGDATSLQVAEPEPGRLVLGHTRLGAVEGVEGEGVLLELSFSAVAAGSGRIELVEGAAFDAFGEPFGIEWLGGEVIVE